MTELEATFGRSENDGRVRLAKWSVPWLLAVAGLGMPLLAGGLAGWSFVVGWAIAVVVFAVARRISPTIREVGRPALLLPVLFVLGLVGGWYLIPADLAWLVIETHDQRVHRENDRLRPIT